MTTPTEVHCAGILSLFVEATFHGTIQTIHRLSYLDFVVKFSLVSAEDGISSMEHFLETVADK